MSDKLEKLPAIGGLAGGADDIGRAERARSRSERSGSSPSPPRKKLDVWLVAQTLSLLPDPIALIDFHGYILVANNEFNDSVRVRPQHNGRRSILSAIAKEDRDSFAKAIHLLVKISDVQILEVGRCLTFLKETEGTARSEHEFWSWTMSWDGMSDFLVACAR